MAIRFFSDFYDSVNQRVYQTVQARDPRIKSRYIGRIRLDIILSNRLVFTDAQILDGVFFNTVDPNFLVKMLARDDEDDNLLMAIEIRSRAGKLENALLQFVTKDEPDGRREVKPFAFSIVQDANKREIVDRVLSEWPPDKIKSWESILQVFKLAGVDPGEIEHIEKKWGQWFRLQEEGKILVLPWKRERGFPITKLLGGDERFFQGISSQLVIELAQWIVGNPYLRAPFDSKVNSLRKTLQQSSDLRDLQILEARYHRAYNKALSWQHECQAFESVVSNLLEIAHFESAGSENALEQVSDDLSIGSILQIEDIDKSFLYKLGKLPSGDFKHYFFNNQDDLQKWWWHHDINALQKAIENLANLMPHLRPESNSDSSPMPDIIQVMLEFVLDKLVGLPLDFLKKLDDIRIKYYSERSQKEKIVQRIIDLAEERETGSLEEDDNEQT